MNNESRVLFFFISLFLANNSINAQVRKIDTSFKMNGVGYRVTCSNKSADQNTVSITPLGFKSEGSREIDFPIKGIVGKAAIDDLNDDGYPDLLIFMYGGLNGVIGNVIGISSEENKSLAQIYFPDIYNDPKLRDGYKGHDEFTLMVGTLLRSFPIYKPDDTIDNPTGGKRFVQYKVMPDEGHLSFKVLRSYETH